MSSNDYGFELLVAEEPPLEEALAAGLLSPENLVDDIPASLNATEMAKRQFREIARVAGLVFPGFPRAGKTARQLQATSGLFFDVFRRYDPGNLLLTQAHREVLERQLERSRLGRTLQRIAGRARGRHDAAKSHTARVSALGRPQSRAGVVGEARGSDPAHAALARARGG